MNINKSEIMKGVLTVLATAGVITVAIMAPNALQIFARRHKPVKKFNGVRLKRSVVSMNRRGLVSISKKHGQVVIKLTKKGLNKIKEFDIANIKIIPLKIWDRKWRIVIFDIPEKFKQNRQVFQGRLKLLGFIMIQRSVWVCPYPCEKEIQKIAKLYEVDSFVNYITATELDIQSKLLKEFKLLT